MYYDIDCMQAYTHTYTHTPNPKKYSPTHTHTHIPATTSCKGLWNKCRVAVVEHGAKLPIVDVKTWARRGGHGLLCLSRAIMRLV